MIYALVEIISNQRTVYQQERAIHLAFIDAAQAIFHMIL